MRTTAGLRRKKEKIRRFMSRENTQMCGLTNWFCPEAEAKIKNKLSNRNCWLLLLRDPLTIPFGTDRANSEFVLRASLGLLRTCK